MDGVDLPTFENQHLQVFTTVAPRQREMGSNTLKDQIAQAVAGEAVQAGGERAAAPIARSYCVVNERGLHARAATRIVQTLKQYSADVQLEKDGLRVDSTSIIGILRLMAAKGTWITAYGQGPDAEAALDAIGALISDNFG